MVIKLEGRKGFIFQTLLQGLKEAHKAGTGGYKVEVQKKDEVDSKFLNAVKKEYSAKFIDDADYLIKVAIPKEEPAPEEPTPEEPVTESKNSENGEEGSRGDSPNGETEETSKLKETIIETVQRRLFIPETDKVEFFDLNDFKKEGYAVGFFKVSLGK